MDTISRLVHSRLVLVVAATTATLLAAAVALLGAASLLEWFPVYLVDGKQTVDYARAVSDARNSLIQLCGGVVLLGGLVFTARNYILSRTNQRAERFTKAIDQLGNRDSIGVRIGGIYGLRMIAQQDKQYWNFVDDILASFVRQNGSNSTPPADIEAALKVLGSRGKRSEQEWTALDFRGAKLKGVHCTSLDLGRAIFNDAELDGADFTDTSLVGAQFENASMKKVVLSGADCRRCNLRNADLREAEFLSAKLEKADRTGAVTLGAKYLTQQQMEVMIQDNET